MAQVRSGNAPNKHGLAPFLNDTQSPILAPGAPLNPAARRPAFAGAFRPNPGQGVKFVRYGRKGPGRKPAFLSALSEAKGPFLSEVEERKGPTEARLACPERRRGERRGQRSEIGCDQTDPRPQPECSFVTLRFPLSFRQEGAFEKRAKRNRIMEIYQTTAIFRREPFLQSRFPPGGSGNGPPDATRPSAGPARYTFSAGRTFWN